MSFLELIRIELKKVRRSKILLLISIPPLLVVISGITNLSRYFTPEYPSAWEAMLVQSALLFGYYLLPFSMVVVGVMIAQRENQNNGILKMLALPVSRAKMALAKLVVLLCYLAMEIAVFFAAFIVAGTIATQAANLNQSLPILYLLKWSVLLFVTAVPATAAMWMITVMFEKPALSIGLNMLLVIPGVLVANTPFWPAYPYCYSGYVVTTELQRISGGMEATFDAFPFVPAAILITLIAILVSSCRFGKKEMR
ncbi:ABC-2 family transporter protein [Ruminiclostridium hungatei]|uniref:ABC-2 family transporter protein n=1 Tax=Ruminiclostridium hungatei TaxID=48256 RepID=A0A1V4SH32_RUMHU|nr:ABC transporter permease [Ruminiclostridium hungatei]OPX42551.1 ABC-2 family transporter protein [Ruminiclostridium hungatei]